MSCFIPCPCVIILCLLFNIHVQCPQKEILHLLLSAELLPLPSKEMNSMSLLLTFYGVMIVLVVYLWFSADVEDSGLNGTLSRFFLISLPQKVTAASSVILGKQTTLFFQRVYHYVVYERNPILVICYLLIINGAFICWLLYGVPFLPMNSSFTPFHYYFAFFGVFFAQLTFYLACTKPPGRLTTENVQCFNECVSYDGLMYVSRYYCTTCLLPKIPRSKHCSLCGYCVPVFDHHCVWYVIAYCYSLLLTLTACLLFLILC
jgi:hypothetical protein